jgi:outer membrane receptor protein involved in Fe transport
MFRYVYTLLVSLLVFWPSSFAYGQNAQVQGQVLDPSGAGIAKALVRVVDRRTGTEAKAETNETGQYTVPGLTPGPYTIYVEAAGFGTAVSDLVTLNAGQNAVWDFTLKVGGNTADVVVTAEKRDENIQDVPVPVTVLKAATLVDNGELRLRDYYTRVPGFDVAPNYVGTQNLAIRGVTTGGLANPTVGVMIDEEPFGSSTDHGNSVPDLDPGELSRIEVLRGPQGTLYGSNSMGGLVKFVTVEPSTAGFSTTLSAGANGVSRGDTAGYSVRGSANVPLGDALAVRASAYTRIEPGWIENPVYHTEGVNQVRAAGGRLSTLWRPSDHVSLKLSGLYQRLKSNGNPETVVAPGLGLFQQNYVPGAGWDDRKIQDYAATLKAYLGGLKLTSISAYNVNADRNTLDYTFAVGTLVKKYFPFPNNIYDTNEVDRKFAQEVRLGGSAGALDWLAGGFYTHEKTIRHTYIHAVNPANGQIIGEYYYSYPGPDDGGDRQYEEYAGFANLTYHFTEQFDVQVGGRESHNRVFNKAGGISVGPRNTDLGRANPFISPAVGADGTVFTYLVTPEYKITPNAMAYARFSSGYRPGSPNTILPGIPQQANPDKTENYEVGAKADLFNHVLSIDTSLYYINWSDIQFQLVDPVLHVSYLTNGAGAKSEGVELSVAATPVTGLTISGWASYDEAILTDRFPATSSAYGVAGNRLPMTPRWSGNFSVEQYFLRGNRMTCVAGADVSSVGERFGQFTSSAVRQPLPAYTQLDVHVGAKGNSWSANLYADNLTNEHGLLNGGPGYFYTSAFIYSRPRLIGINVVKTF